MLSYIQIYFLFNQTHKIASYCKSCSDDAIGNKRNLGIGKKSYI